MALFIKSDKDPVGKFVRVEAGFKSTNGTCFLVLRRLPPLYAKPPLFVVELSNELIDHRGEDAKVMHRAYAIQDFSEKELKFLIRAGVGGDVLPFFNFSYPVVIRRIGKSFYKFTEDELVRLVGTRVWKLIGGRR